MSVIRPMGTETEYGILERGAATNPIELSNAIVRAYAEQVPHVPWDYRGEDPLADARGYRLPRAAADPSMLTDDPERHAPSGPGTNVAPQAPHLERSGPANAVLTNGARLYVDHAHPEYSGPEVLTPLEAVRFDRAGDAIMTRAAANLKAQGRDVGIYKNNVDGKGASYGTHENYLIDRDVAFGDVVTHLTTFFAVRPLICGAGRVGIGQRSEEAAFQISQRADYIENEVGLETTFNRPIINTRDEPHADARRWRRLHVIVGDANTFDVSTYVKLGVTSLVLWFIERGEVPLDLDALSLSAPVFDCYGVSRDPLTHTLSTASGRHTALDIHSIFRDLIADALAADGITDVATVDVMETWSRLLDGLRTDLTRVETDIEWVGKLHLLERLRERGGLAWDDPKLAAADLQFSDLDPARSLSGALDRSGKVRRLVTEAEISSAIEAAPTDTRAYLRGHFIASYPRDVAAASWTSLTVRDPDSEALVRIGLPDPYGGSKSRCGELPTDDLSASLAAVQ
ncbi:proteasome accessory factor PafA2 [Bowdeniella nasicola]|uniref:Proteasome accessory factor PafA2 n=1 Tax=Bowdeniella nasicola TaxID=208480 RepID=A0A1Q5Q4Z7_9ACTO|nr:depupylase/deamidase Dop [Bowdeniella nasicola]OKL54861.1 proteasome accessory factor PafA2 [Bowdeniella nasicola]